MTTGGTTDIFDVSKTSTSGTKDDHDFIRFTFDVNDCAVRVRKKMKELMNEQMN